jgi:hypothetical protein
MKLPIFQETKIRCAFQPAKPVTAPGPAESWLACLRVEALARRMAASMPNAIDIGDLVQDGVLG